MATKSKKDQIPVLMGRLVSKQAGFRALPSPDRQWIIENTDKAIALAVTAIKNRDKPREKSKIAKKVAQASSVKTGRLIPASTFEQARLWTQFYTEVLGIDLTESIDPALPLPTTGFGWIIPVHQDVTMNQVLKAMRARFDVDCYTEDLDANVPTNDRKPSDGSYAIRVRDRIEADEENRNFSANQITAKEIRGMTLLERMLLELFYVWVIGEHLDIVNITLCSASRNSGGGVPGVYWYRDHRRLCIDWYRPDSSYGSLGARAAVTLEPSKP